MKMMYKSGKWIVSFNEKILVCEIENIEKRFFISFETKGKKITLETRDLDGTFKMLEEVYNRKTFVQQY